MCQDGSSGPEVVARMVYGILNKVLNSKVVDSDHVGVSKSVSCQRFLQGGEKGNAKGFRVYSPHPCTGLKRRVFFRPSVSYSQLVPSA